jgi:hypothetical protein
LPEWVAARLWDRRTDDADKSAAIRLWVDRWRILGSPSLPKGAWDDQEAAAFREASIETLRVEAGLVGWDELRSSFRGQMGVVHEQSGPGIEGYLPELPATLVDRALWLESPRLERSVAERCRPSSVSPG